MENPSGLILSAIGVFSVLGAVLDWNFFMNHRKAALLVKLFTRTEARIFYVLLGSGLIVAGVLMAMGIIKNSN